MNLNDYRNKYNDQYLNDLVSCLNPADIVSPEVKNSYGFKISQIGGGLVTNFNRLFIKKVRSGIKYNESHAHALLVDYIKDPACRKALAPQRDKIIHIYKQLKQISHGNGSWADDLDEKVILSEFDASLDKLKDDEVLVGQMDPDVDDFLFVETSTTPPKTDPAAATHQFRLIPKLPTPSAKLLFHIHANEFGGSSELEGENRENTTQYLRKYLKASSRYEGGEIYAEVADELKNRYVAAPTMAYNDFREKITKAFKKGTPLLLSGGWNGEPSGHAIYYEIIPTSQTHATFRLFNTAAGVQYHDSVVEGTKTKYRCYVDWENVSLEQLCQETTHQVLSELENLVEIPGTKAKTEFNERDIYQGLHQLFGGPALGVNKGTTVDPQVRMLTQQSGVCAWRSLLAFMRTKIPLNDYKRMKCDLKLQSLHDFVTKLERNPEVVEIRLVMKNYEKISRSLTHLHSKQIISDTYLEQADQVLKVVDAWIKENERFLSPKVTGKFDELYEIEGYLESAKIPIAMFYGGVQYRTLSDSPIEMDLVRLRNLEEIINDVSMPVQKKLSLAVPLFEELWSKGNFDELHYGIEQFISSLSIDKNFWIRQIPGVEEAQKMMCDFSSLLRWYVESSIALPDRGVWHPEKMYVIAKTLYLENLIFGAVNMHSTYKSVRLFDLMGFKTLFNHISDPRKNREMVEIINSSPQPYDHDVLNFAIFEAYSYPSMQRLCSINFGGSGIDLPGKLMKFIHDQAPESVDLIASQTRGFSRMKKGEQEALIYQSDSLPPWIIALRTASLYAKMVELDLTNCTLKRANQMFKFSTKEKGDKTNLEVEFGPNLSVPFAITQKPENIFNPSKNPLQALKLHKARDIKIDSSRYNEHRLLWPGKSKELEMTKEEYKELFRIFTPNGISLIEALDYFTSHAENLLNPDYQNLLWLVFFQVGNIDQTMQNIRRFSPRIQYFITNYLNDFSIRNETHAVIFLLRFGIALKPFLRDPTFLPDASRRLIEIIKEEARNPETKSLAYAALITHFNQLETLSEEEVFHLITGAIYINTNKDSLEIKPQPTELRLVRQTLLKHADVITKTLRRENQDGPPNQGLLNRVIHELIPDSPDGLTWRAETTASGSTTYISEDGDIILNPLTFLLASPNKNSKLPEKILNHNEFRQIFPGIVEGKYVGKGAYNFMDKDGSETSVEIDEYNYLQIKKRFKNEPDRFYRYLSKEIFEDKESDQSPKCKIGSYYILNNCTFWLAVIAGKDKKTAPWIYAVDPENLERKYRINFNFQRISTAPNNRGDSRLLEERFSPNEICITDVEELSTGLKLGKPATTFCNFEDQSYIHFWYSQGSPSLRRIDFPRFNLSFTPSPEGWQSAEWPGYKIAPQQTVKQLGKHSHYLILINDDGKRKVLMANQILTAPKKMEVMEARYTPQRALESGAPQSYLEFDLTVNDRLFNKKRGPNLYLAYVLAAAQEYSSAAAYLKKFGPKPGPYTKEEQQSLIELSKLSKITGDKSGNGTALQLFGLKLLIENNPEITADLITLESLNALYDTYLTHYNNITVLKLSKNEEVTILLHLLKRGFDPRYYQRLEQLDRKMAHRLPRIDQTADVPEGEEQHPFRISHKGNEIPQKPLCITRPYKDLYTCFHHYFNIAQSGDSPEKEILQVSLIFLRLQDNGSHNNMADFFELLLSHPEKFKSPKDPEFRNDHTNWNLHINSICEAEFVNRSEKNPQITSQRPLTVEPSPFSYELSRKSTEMNSRPLILSPIESISEAIRKMNCVKKDTLPVESSSLEEMKMLLMRMTSEDPVQRKEAQRLIADLDILGTQPGQTIYSIQEDNLSELEAVLQRDHSHDKFKIETLSQAILELANRPPEAPTEAIIHNLQRGGTVQTVISLEEAMILFGKNDPKAFQERNPALTERDIDELILKIGEVLLYITRHQQRERCQSIINEISLLNIARKSDKEKYQDLVNRLSEALLAERSYDPIEKPAYLVFEAFADLIMRPAQTEKLARFMDEGHPNLIMEMIMGSGKSKILLPLLGLMRADGKTLSMIIVPTPLFESIAQDTQDVLQDAFNSSLISLKVERDSKFDLPTILSLHSKLDPQNKHCLIMTGKSMSTLILKQLELYFEHYKQCLEDPTRIDQLPLVIKEMEALIALISTSGHPIIDEADLVLNVLHEVNFTSGSKVAIRPIEIAVLHDLYSLLYTDDRFKQICRLESDPTSNPSGAVLTEEIYRTQMQRPLAEALIHSCSQINGNSSLESEAINGYFRKLTETDKELLLDYLCRTPQRIQASQKYFNTIPAEIQDIIALAGEELCQLLPFTLTRNCDEKYGVDEQSDDPLAIPFSAANTPVRGSQFANAHITMNFTFQNYMKKGFKAAVIEAQIKLLQERALKEIAASGNSINLEDTEAYKIFNSLCGELRIPLFKYNRDHIERLTNYANSNPALKLKFVTTIILPRLEIYEYKISCNPQNMVSMFQRVCGFTGTLWNGYSMHPSLELTPEIGTDGKTLVLLWKHSRDKVLTLDNLSSLEMIHHLHAHAHFDMISDVGGYFKDGSNSQIAHSLAEISGKEVVFYDTAGEQQITQGKSSIPLNSSRKKAEERLTYLDQSHTTGADVPQKRDAVAIVTIGRNTLLRDLLQGVWRLRGLDKSQRIQFILSKEVESIIRQKLQLTDDTPIQLDAILQFVVLNQSQQQGKDNYKALREQLANIPQLILMNVLMNPAIKPAYKVQAFRNLMSTWIKPAANPPRVSYGTLLTQVNSQEVIEGLSQQSKQKLEQIYILMPWLEEAGLKKSVYLEEVDKIVERVSEHLQSTLPSPAREIEEDGTVEAEKEVSAEEEVQVEVELNTETAHAAESPDFKSFTSANFRYYNSFAEFFAATIDYSRFKDFGNLPAFSIGSYMETTSPYKPFFHAFQDLYMTANVLASPETSLEFQLLGPNRIDLHHLLVEGDKVTVLSILDGEKFISSPHYYNLNLGFIDPAKKPSDEQLRKIVKVKFLNGNAIFTPKELELLREWFLSEGVDKMIELHRMVLEGHPLRTSRYQGSNLQKIFKDLRAGPA